MPERRESPASEPPPRLRRLIPPGVPASVEQIVEELKLAELAQQVSPTLVRDARPRPYLMLNMVSTADGRATLEGRSGPIGDAADRELFHGLRTAVDAVMVGAGTVRVERYRRLVRDERLRQIRRERELAEEPWACIVSGRLALPADIPILSDTAARVLIVTPSAASLAQAQATPPRTPATPPQAQATAPQAQATPPRTPATRPQAQTTPPQAQGGAQIEYVRCAREGMLDLTGAMGQLYERFQIRTILCEGGPHTNSQLLADGLVDELFLSLSPKLAGGDATDEALRIVAGPAIDAPLEMELISAFEHESHLFLRYRLAHD